MKWMIIIQQGNRIKRMKSAYRSGKKTKSQKRRQQQTLFVSVIVGKGAKRRSRPEVDLLYKSTRVNLKYLVVRAIY